MKTAQIKEIGKKMFDPLRFRVMFDSYCALIIQQFFHVVQKCRVHVRIRFWSCQSELQGGVEDVISKEKSGPLDSKPYRLPWFFFKHDDL